jgi:hypothetical protein
VSVLLGNGDGTFALQAQYSTGDKYVQSPVLGDFNGDGRPDIGVISLTNDSAGVLLGDGQGGLSPFTTYPASRNMAGIAAGDLTNNGYTDLVTTGTAHNTMEVLINDGVWGPARAGHDTRISQQVPANAVVAADQQAPIATTNETHTTAMPTRAMEAPNAEVPPEVATAQAASSASVGTVPAALPASDPLALDSSEIQWINSWSDEDGAIRARSVSKGAHPSLLTLWAPIGQHALNRAHGSSAAAAAGPYYE